MRRFFASPDTYASNESDDTATCVHMHKQADTLQGLSVVGTISFGQEDVLQALRAMLEVDDASPFVQANKKQLLSYCEIMAKFTQESEDFCAQALTLTGGTH